MKKKVSYIYTNAVREKVRFYAYLECFCEEKSKVLHILNMIKKNNTIFVREKVRFCEEKSKIS